MNRASYLVVAVALTFLGCGTLDPRFSGLTKQLGADKPWLQPVAQPDQIVHKEGVGIFARKGGYWSVGLDLQCGVYLDGSETVVMFKVENKTLAPIKLSGTVVTVSDAQGNSLARKNPEKWQQAPDLPIGAMVYGSDMFIGVLSAYPIAVTWKFPDGKTVAFTYNEPAK